MRNNIWLSVKETDGNNKPHEGYYTKTDLQELVRYAKTKFVEIICVA
ncbi:hypothetical protein E9993_19145 [Labilibacter sediminis]|nr:hypothetical protein E9993_19145 [Labilibacter sediminis]